MAIRVGTPLTVTGAQPTGRGRRVTLFSAVYGVGAMGGRNVRDSVWRVSGSKPRLPRGRGGRGWTQSRTQELSAQGQGTSDTGRPEGPGDTEGTCPVSWVYLSSHLHPGGTSRKGACVAAMAPVYPPACHSQGTPRGGGPPIWGVTAIDGLCVSPVVIRGSPDPGGRLQGEVGALGGVRVHEVMKVGPP